jgi:hypothetical protein
LFKASWLGHVEVVKELINHNADIQAITHDDSTPLILGLFLDFLFLFSFYINIISSFTRGPR